ncbi:MAG: hypothetical protein AB1487_01965 [Thermodesulfobacteriota bacterium]
MALYKAALDWSIIEEYFVLFGLEDSRPGYEVIGAGYVWDSMEVGGDPILCAG